MCYWNNISTQTELKNKFYYYLRIHIVYTGTHRPWYYTTLEEGENILMCFPKDMRNIDAH